MSAFRLDPVTGDLAFVNNRLVAITGAEEKAQKIRNRLRLFQGEWFANTQAGTPWYQQILGIKNPPIALIEKLFRDVILSVEGIAYVQTVTLIFDPAKRTLVYEFDAVADDGTNITGGEGIPFIVSRP